MDSVGLRRDRVDGWFMETGLYSFLLRMFTLPAFDDGGVDIVTEWQPRNCKRSQDKQEIR